MFLSLLAAVMLMAVAGLPHCATMCATPCAAVLPRGVSPAVLAGRTLGYAALGAAAAGMTGLLARWSQWAAVLVPLWVMVLAATALTGGWMVAKGALPPALERQGLQAYRWLQRHAQDSALLRRWPALRPVLPALLGATWAALPCGLLYSAAMVAALANTVWQGAALMGAFSAPGAVVLWWLPRQLRRRSSAEAVQPNAPSPPVGTFTPRPVIPVLPIAVMASASAAAKAAAPAAATEGGVAPSAGQAVHPLARAALWWPRLADPRWALRLSGALMSCAAGWALVHRLTQQWQAWCA